MTFQDYNVPRPIIRPGDQSGRPFFGLRSGTPRPNPNLGSVLVRDSNARSHFVGHTFRAQYRIKKVQLVANYTLSFNKSDDDNERQLGGITYQNPFALSREYHWSSLDSRHQVGAYAIYQAPYGLELRTTLRVRSGLPIDASTGTDSSELLSGNIGNRPLEAPGLPFLRNSFRNRGFKSIDFRILKSFALRETVHLQLSGEIFNLFDFDNVAFLSADTFPNNPAFIYGPGISTEGQEVAPFARFLRSRLASGAYDPQTTAQIGTPLQAQVGIRLRF